MAYTIISQNNSTTTLSDGVNTITVPSRVNLTSGNFTIVEVNNNMATLEDGDGNVYRDIPCVATLVDEGGIQKSTMPTASADEFGKIYQFVGTTDANYTNGYFYKGVYDTPIPSSATISQTVGEGLEDLAVNKTTFETQITESGTYDFIARLNREHITATIDTDTVRMDRDESHDVEGAVAWTPDGETYFYTEELVPDVDDEVFADPDGETVAGAVASYSTEAIGWEFGGEFVDLADYGISYTPADPTATVSYSSEALGTVSVDADTFATQVAESDLYIFDCRVTEDTTKWYRGSDEITLATYGITITGAAEDGNSIHIQYVSEPPHQDDVITVNYTAEQATYKWQQTDVQPGGGGSGAVDSVNGKTGVVILDGEDIEATVGSTEDTIQNHLQSLRNDLGDLADDVAEKTKKNVITLTGESGTLTAAQIAQVLDDTSVLEIVCDGIVFRLSNKDSTLTYRTYINTDCAVSSDVEFKAIYVQLNSEAANYGAWTLEEVSTGGGSGLPDQTGHSGEFLTTDGTNASWAAVNALQNTATGEDSLTILGTPCTVDRAINIGVGSVATGYNSTAIGQGASTSGNNALAIGANSSASGSSSVAINGKVTSGYNKSIAIGANVSGGKSIIIMTGNTNYYTSIAATYCTALGYIANPNNLESNSFYVGVGINANQTVKVVSSDGTIPADRFASTTGLADGNYRLRLTMADGVPTLSWVAE